MSDPIIIETKELGHNIADLAVLPDGRVLVADALNHRINVLSATCSR